jgi:predicted acylesterase/phospholipase RssA
MKYLIIFIFYFNPLQLSHANADKKIAMIFNGGGFNTALYLGMLKGIENAGLKPDIIIGTCGGSIPTAIAHALKDSQEQLDFIQSEEFYELLKIINFTKYVSIPKTLMLVQDFYFRYSFLKFIPNIFTKYLMNVPIDFYLSKTSGDFTPTEHRSVIIAAKILFDESKTNHRRRKNEKLYQETIFTDELTANELKDFTSPTSTLMHSVVTSEIKIVTDSSLNKAARASISDPFYMAPGEVHGDRFLTGGIDLYPIELAHKLADEVILIYPERFDYINLGALLATYSFSQNERIKMVLKQNIDYMIDNTDFPLSLELDPYPHYKLGKMVSRNPETYAAYREITKKQYEYGYQRAVEASKNWKSRNHIRFPDKIKYSF